MSNHYRIQGDLCETAAMLYFVKQGFVVSKPMNHSSFYDLIVDDGTTLMKVECKSSSCKVNNTSYTVSLKTSGGNRSGSSDFKRINSQKTDKVFIVDGDNNMYCYDASELNGRRSVNVNNTIVQYVGNFGNIMTQSD